MSVPKLVLFLCITIFNLSSQPNLVIQDNGCTPQNLPCEYNPNWDWLYDPNNQAGNWDAQVQGTLVHMGSPFFSLFPPTQDIITITNTNDYLPQQGWVLLARDFGCINSKDVSSAIPFFMLYNKYRSIIRLFLYFGNANQNTNASVKLKWNSTLNPSNSDNSLLTLSNNLAKPNVSYPLGSNNEIHLNYLNTVPNSGGWTVTEFQVHFDPNTINSLGQFRFLEFNLSLGNYSDIGMSGEFSFTTESATAKEPAPVPPAQNPSGLLNFIATAKEFLGKVPKASDVSNGFTAIVATTDTLNNLFHTQFTRDLNKSADELNNGNLKKFLVGTATIAEQLAAGKYLDIASQVIALFIGKSNNAASPAAPDFIQPTISRGSIKLNGTISTLTNPKNIYLQLPGTSHKYPSTNNLNCTGLPVYDCPLGLVSLQEAPTIEMKKHAILSGARSYTVLAPLTQDPFNTDILGQNIYEQFNSYKVSSNLTIALNGAVGVNIKSIKACLVATQDPNVLPVDSTYALLSHKTSSKGIGSTGYNELTIVPTHSALIAMKYIRYGYERSYITSNKFQLNGMDMNKKEYSYSTSFVDISEFKNTVIVAQPAMKIYIKIQVIMVPTNPGDDQTPIVYVIPYDLAGKIVDVGNSDPYQNGPIPKFTCAQQVNANLGSDVISATPIDQGTYTGVNLKTSNNVTVNANHPTLLNVNFKGANSVKMIPGFSAAAINNNYFKAEIDNVGQCMVGTNALVLNTYFQNCSSSALDRMANQNSLANQNNFINFNEKLKLYVIPNPNSGDFKIMFNQSVSSGIIKIVNVLGQTVFESNLTESSSIHNINLPSELGRGTYYIMWFNDTQMSNGKFVIE